MISSTNKIKIARPSKAPYKAPEKSVGKTWQRNANKRQQAGFSNFNSIFAVAVGSSVVVSGFVIYVVAHFISKVW